MTASASVVEAGRALVDALRAYGFPVSGGARASLTDGGSDEAYALNEAAVAFSDALNTPHPAEQDAREAVARIEALAKAMSDPEVDRFTMPGKTANNHAADLRTILALTQAAPDGCAEAADHDRIVADLADELIYGGGLVNRGVDRGLVVVERSDKSDPHYRLCTALEARRAASPAPPAQGAGG